jgi:RHS repeat-associated protein
MEKFQENMRFDPFGITIKSVGVVSPIRFSTKYTDLESDLIYFGHRFYQPQTGRWMSRDPLAPENSVNLYSYVVNQPTNFVDFDGLQGRERGFRRVKVKKYVQSSPNWDGASGSLDRTYHSIILCVPKLSMDEALNKMFEDLQRFTYFEPNIARFKPIGGNRGHFDMTDPSMRGTAELGGLSIDVIFHTRAAEKQLLAVTNGNHPLVGVRMWRVEKAGHTAKRESVIRVTTEAYDQANGWLNDIGRSQSGREQQNIMWTMYLDNIEAGWKKSYGAYRNGKMEKSIQTDQSLPNPFRSLLPPELQRSEYREFVEIVP